MRWEVATDRRFRRVVAPGQRRDRPEPRPHGQGRRRPAWSRRPGTTTASTYKRRHQPGRPHPHRAGRRRRRRTTCASAWCPAPTGRPAGSPPTAHLAKRDDLHAVLHLGDYLYEYGPGEYGYGMGERRHPHARAGARDGLAGRLPAAARAVQDRPRPAGPAREVPLDHHLGRPRGHQRPVARRAPRTTSPDRGRLPQAPGARAPRVRRVDAGPHGRHRPARATATGCSGGCGSAGSPRSACSTCARYRSEQVQTALPTPVPAPEAEVSDPTRTITGKPADAAGSRTRSTGPARSGRSSATR